MFKLRSTSGPLWFIFMWNHKLLLHESQVMSCDELFVDCLIVYWKETLLCVFICLFFLIAVALATQQICRKWISIIPQPCVWTEAPFRWENMKAMNSHRLINCLFFNILSISLIPCAACSLWTNVRFLKSENLYLNLSNMISLTVLENILYELCSWENS